MMVGWLGAARARERSARANVQRCWPGGGDGYVCRSPSSGQSFTKPFWRSRHLETRVPCGILGCVRVPQDGGILRYPERRVPWDAK